MKVDLLTDEKSFDDLKPDWADLLKRSLFNTVFLTPEWHESWWQAFRPGKLWILSCRDETGKLLGLAPWFIDDDGIVRFIGCEDVTDYLDVIVDRDHTDDVFACLKLCLAENKDLFKAARLCNIPEGSPTLNIFPQLLSQNQFETQITQQEVCPVIKLPDNWEAYIDSLEKKYRHELRRKLRRSRGAAESLDWYIVDSSHNFAEELNCFLDLMAASDPEKKAFLKDEGNRRFFEMIMPVVHEKGWLQLCFLTINGERVAAYLNFDYRNRIMVYNSGLSHDKYSHLSPGIVLLANIIRYAIEHNYDAFDFLRGDEPYKYHLGGKDTPVYELAVRSATS